MRQTPEKNSITKSREVFQNWKTKLAEQKPQFTSVGITIQPLDSQNAFLILEMLISSF